MAKRGKRCSCSRPDSLLGYLRLQRGISIQQLSESIGVTPMVLWHMEQLNFNVWLSAARKVAQYFKITLDEMVSNDFRVISRLMASGSKKTDERYLNGQKELNAKKLSIGRRGELLIAQWEACKLKPIGFDTAVGAEAGLVPGMGYDVLSFTLDKRPLFIEVKSTSASENVPFHMSANERKFMMYCFKHKIKYELHRIFDLNGHPRREIYTPKDLLKAEMVPYDFIVKMKA